VENFENQQVSHENEIRELQNQILDALNTSNDIERVRLHSYQDLVDQVKYLFFFY
jgi:hypothetical protein